MEKKPPSNPIPDPYQKSKSASTEQTNKVAESVATYVPSPAVIRPSIAGIPVPQEVWQFAVKNELIPHLETAIRLVRESFHQVGEIQLSHDIDPEIENESWITLLVKVKGSTSELLREHLNYKKGMREIVPLSKLPFIRLFLGAD
ncbi:MAG: hypothetical protein ACE5IR_25455 [bacterium]